MIAIPWILIGLEGVAIWLVTFAASKSWNSFAKAVVDLFHSPKTWVRKIWDTSVVGMLVNSIFDTPSVHHGKEALGATAIQHDTTTGGMVAGIASVLDHHAFTVKYLAAGVLDSLHALTAHTIPVAVRTGTRPAREQSERASKQARAAGRATAGATAGALLGIRLGRRAHGEATKAQHDALVAKNAIAVPRPWDLPRVRTKETDDVVRARTGRSVRWWTRVLGAAIGAGVIVRVLVRHLPWYQCSNVKSLARGACGMNRSLLDNLLASLVTVGGFISILTLAKELQDITDLEARAIRLVIREARKVDIPG